MPRSFHRSRNRNRNRSSNPPKPIMSRTSTNTSSSTSRKVSFVVYWLKQHLTTPSGFHPSTSRLQIIRNIWCPVRDQAPLRSPQEIHAALADALKSMWGQFPGLAAAAAVAGAKTPEEPRMLQRWPELPEEFWTVDVWGYLRGLEGGKRRGDRAGWRGRDEGWRKQVPVKAQVGALGERKRKALEEEGVVLDYSVKRRRTDGDNNNHGDDNGDVNGERRARTNNGRENVLMSSSGSRYHSHHSPSPETFQRAEVREAGVEVRDQNHKRGSSNADTYGQSISHRPANQAPPPPLQVRPSRHSSSPAAIEYSYRPTTGPSERSSDHTSEHASEQNQDDARVEQARRRLEHLQHCRYELDVLKERSDWELELAGRSRRGVEVDCEELDEKIEVAYREVRWRARERERKNGEIAEEGRQGGFERSVEGRVE